MTPDEIKAKLEIPDADIRLSDTAGFYWLNVTREHNGHRHTHTTRLDLEPSDAHISAAKQAIEAWWTETESP